MNCVTVTRRIDPSVLIATQCNGLIALPQENPQISLRPKQFEGKQAGKKEILLVLGGIANLVISGFEFPHQE